MNITYETNEKGESVKVTTTDSGTVIKELDRPVPIVVNTTISKREFLKRFTPTEYAAIKTAANANATLDWYWQQFLLAEFIDLADPDTVAGIQMLEGAGLLAPGRAAEILA
jgi:hypothetical protein